MLKLAIYAGIECCVNIFGGVPKSDHNNKRSKNNVRSESYYLFICSDPFDDRKRKEQDSQNDGGGRTNKTSKNDSPRVSLTTGEDNSSQNSPQSETHELPINTVFVADDVIPSLTDNDNDLKLTKTREEHDFNIETSNETDHILGVDTDDSTQTLDAEPEEQDANVKLTNNDDSAIYDESTQSDSSLMLLKFDIEVDETAIEDFDVPVIITDEVEDEDGDEELEEEPMGSDLHSDPVELDEDEVLVKQVTENPVDEVQSYYSTVEEIEENVPEDQKVDSDSAINETHRGAERSETQSVDQLEDSKATSMDASRVSLNNEVLDELNNDYSLISKSEIEQEECGEVR